LHAPIAPREETSLAYAGWRVVAACSAMALFGWGFAFYGHGVYFAALQRAHGWPAATIAGASTASYLLSALLLTIVADGLRRFGPKRFVLGGIVALALALVLLAHVEEPWQLYASYLVMSFGWVALSSATISTILGLWFDAKRGLAFSLALNGASLGGIVVVPVMVLAVDAWGFRATLLGGAVVLVLVLVPIVAAFVDRPEGAGAPARRAGGLSRYQIVRQVGFWSIAGPFAIGFLALVGFIVHQVAILTPSLGLDLTGAAVGVMTGAALLGRLVLGAVVDRLDHRKVAAAAFLGQAVILALFTRLTDPTLLLITCAVFGVGIGNVTTLPSLVVQREFDAASFALVVGMTTALSQLTYAFGPGLMGLVHDLTGGYGVPLIACAALETVAGVLILRRPRAA
jgi:predicted MFS family arabinose efflux permease